MPREPPPHSGASIGTTEDKSTDFPDSLEIGHKCTGGGGSGGVLLRVPRDGPAAPGASAVFRSCQRLKPRDLALGQGSRECGGVKVRISLWFTSQPPPRRPALPQAAQPAPASCQAVGQDQSPSCCKQQPPCCARRHHSQTAVAGGLPVRHGGGSLLGRPGAVSEPRDRLLVAGGEQDGGGTRDARHTVTA